jgi:hypothetical protein
MIHGSWWLQGFDLPIFGRVGRNLRTDRKKTQGDQTRDSYPAELAEPGIGVGLAPWG